MDFRLPPISVYGRTKCMVEDFLHDLCAADPKWQVAEDLREKLSVFTNDYDTR